MGESGSKKFGFTNKGSVNKIRTRGREGVKKDPKNSDIFYGRSLSEVEREIGRIKVRNENRLSSRVRKNHYFARVTKIKVTGM